MRLSLSTAKSGSTWLDRLRTAKGFPDNGVTDLDIFLKNPNFPNPQSLDPRSSDPDTPISDTSPNEGKQFFDIVTDALHELFNFGDKCISNSTKFKKSTRKQPNPRICACPNNRAHGNHNAASEKVTLLRSADSNSGVEGAKVLDKLETDEGERVERDVDLAGFSRTEVTVIDSSYELWKFEKLLYRKKNVWKVRDKKGKSSEVTRNNKKRKTSGEVEEDHHGRKKWKKSHKKEGNAEACQLPLNERNKSEVEQVGRRPGVEKSQAGHRRWKRICDPDKEHR
ncbi:uncharacterized protein LOC127245931 isoform X2 [Andrographis paniculata]|uniref:uncharacterized protein LOC127245931 isoform X2 n=1 Tax=Andrographis paniculata TaxID=175694 RepID=UPI0021E84333|nr:uncharacterized protein LOC127245931 isoform X2 [Andrographis paniculata]